MTLIDGRADLLAAALTLGALAAWTRDPEARSWRAPALAAAAFLVRATSLTPIVAIVMWLLARRQPWPAGRAVVRFAMCAAVGIALMTPVHGPTWYANALGALLSHAVGRSNPLRGPTELVRYLGSFGELAAFVALAIVALLSRRLRATPVATFALVSLALTTGVMTNYGSGPNHLVELAALAAIGASVWAVPRLERGAIFAYTALLIAVLGATWRDLMPVLRYASAPRETRSQVIAAVRAAPGEALTEDPLIALAAGRRPLVADFDALRALALQGSSGAQRVIADLERGRYALVVLNADLEQSASWYRTIGFDDRTIAPLRARYHAAGVADEFHLYARAPELPIHAPVAR